MMLVHFMKDCPLNGTTLATDCDSLEDQKTYMARYDSFEVEVNTVRLGEPLRIARSLSEMVDYSYGWITYDDSGYRYYFYVVDLAMITETQTEVRYNIDTYETLVHQTGISFTGVHLLNAPKSALKGAVNAIDDHTWMKHVIVPEPATWNITKQRDGGNTDNDFRSGYLLVTGYGDEVLDTTTGERGAHTWTIMYSVNSMRNITEVLNGQWFQNIRAKMKVGGDDVYNPVLLSQSDIYYACFVPTSIYALDKEVTPPTSGWEKNGWIQLFRTPDEEGRITSSGWFSLDTRSAKIDDVFLHVPNPEIYGKDFEVGMMLDTVKSTPTVRESITDARGNIIWECPVGSEYTVTEGFVEWTATSANIVLHLVSEVKGLKWDSTEQQMKEITTDTDSVTVVIPCETVDLYQSSWLEYFYRQRESDRALRQIQMTQQLANSGLGALSSAGMGGAYSGRGGAQSAFGGEAVSALGGWLVQSISDPFTQKVMDRQAMRQADPLLLAGSMTEEIFLHNHCGKTVREMDVASATAYQHRWNALGYDCDMFLTYNPIRNNNDRTGTQSFRGYFHCHGRAPRQWLAEIEQRLAEGVTFI